MKNATSSSLRILPAALCLMFALLATNVKAQTLYWDINGATDGAGGPTPSGSWEDPSWTTDSTGNLATRSWVEGDFPVFSAGTDATGAYTITANSDHTIAGMQVATGTVTVNGPGTLSIASGMQGFTGTNLTINAVLAGTGGYQGASGNVVYLYGSNTFSGGCNLNLGQIFFTNGAAFGTGPINPYAAGFSALLASGGAPTTLTNAFEINVASAGINFASSVNTPLTCTGKWDLQQDLHVRNNGANTSPLTLSGVLSGPGGVSVSGSFGGSIVLSGANTYTGPTSFPNASDGNNGALAFTLSVSSFNSVNGGTPLLASSSLGAPTDVTSGTIHIGYNSTTNIVIYTGPGETTDRVIDIVGTARGPWIENDGTGPLIFTTDLTTSTGGTSANTKWLTLQGSYVGGINEIRGKVQNFDSTHQVGIAKDGAGTWMLTAANPCSGQMNLYAGTLIIGGSGQMGNGIYSGAIFNAGTLIYASSATQTNSGNMFGPGSLIVSNSAANLWLSGTNSPTSITIAAGSLVGNHANPGAFAPGVVFTFGSSGHSATLDLFSRTTSGIGGLVVASGATGATIQNGGTGAATLGFSGGTSTFSGNIISGPGSGTIAVTVNSGSLTLSGNNTFTAGVTVNGASTFAVGSDTAAGTGTLNINAVNDTIQSADANTRTLANAVTLGQNANFGAPGTGNLVFSGAVNSGGAAKTLTINNTTTTFNGVISGNGAVTITKAGPGRLVFGAVNTYNKATAITGGTLALSSAGSISSSVSISIAGGTTFDVSGVAAAVTLGSSQVLQAGGTAGSSATITTASGKGLTLGASSPLQFTAFDGSTVPLTISGGGSLAIATGNAVTVTSTTQLALGSYKLVQIGSGNTTAVTGTPATSVTVNGSGAVGNASLRVAGGELYLDVQNLAPVTQMSIGPGSGGTFTISYSGGAGSQFVLLQTNNVVAPLINWTRLLTNTATSGSFTITPGSDPAEFYRVKSE